MRIGNLGWLPRFGDLHPSSYIFCGSLDLHLNSFAVSRGTWITISSSHCSNVLRLVYLAFIIVQLSVEIVVYKFIVAAPEFLFEVAAIFVVQGNMYL